MTLTANLEARKHIVQLGLGGHKDSLHQGSETMKIHRKSRIQSVLQCLSTNHVLGHVIHQPQYPAIQGHDPCFFELMFVNAITVNMIEINKSSAKNKTNLDLSFPIFVNVLCKNFGRHQEQF